jgi:flagellar basal body-associated protein FliL
MTQLRTRSQAGLIVAVVVLAVAGLALIGAYFYLSRQPASADSGWVNPQALTRASNIAPDLAVLTLAGEPDDRIIRASLDANERETAYATLAYSMLLPDTVRGGQWLVMGQRLR